MYFTRKTEIDYLNRVLNLPATGNEQDWELELADPSRVCEFIEFYREPDNNSETKMAVWALVSASLNDAIDQGYQTDEMAKVYEETALSDIGLLEPVLRLWLADENDDFAISGIIRRLKLD